MRDQAEQRIGHLYPKATLPDGSEANVIAWIWARMVTRPNPACGVAMPLVKSFWLSKKKDRPTWLKPVVNGKRITFEVCKGKQGPEIQGTVARSGATCVACGSPVPFTRIREWASTHGFGTQLMAVVAAGDRRRIYLEADTGSGGVRGRVMARCRPGSDGHQPQPRR